MDVDDPNMKKIHDNNHLKSIRFELVDFDDTDNSDDGATKKEEFGDGELCRKDCSDCFHNSGLFVEESLDDINVNQSLQVLEPHFSRITERRQHHELDVRCDYMALNCMMRMETSWAMAPFRVTVDLRMNSFRRSKNLSANVFQVVEESFYE